MTSILVVQGKHNIIVSYTRIKSKVMGRYKTKHFKLFITLGAFIPTTMVAL